MNSLPHLVSQRKLMNVASKGSSGNKLLVLARRGQGCEGRRSRHIAYTSMQPDARSRSPTKSVSYLRTGPKARRIGCLFLWTFTLLIPSVRSVAATDDLAWLNGIGIYGGDDHGDSEEQIREFVAKCQAHGVTILYPSLSGGSTVVWKTELGQHYPAYQKGLDAGYDRLELLIEHAHAAGIKIYPSVAVGPASRILEGHSEWETRDRQGRGSHETTGRALAFSYPGARQAKIALLMELVNQYEIDGLMLDYCRYPENSDGAEQQRYGFYGYDQPLIDTCQKLYGFDPREVPIDSEQWNFFNNLRCETVAAFIGELRAAIKASGRQIRLGGFTDNDIEEDARAAGRDAGLWSRRGLVDDVFLAIYFVPITDMPQVVQKAKSLLHPDTPLVTSLCPYRDGLKDNKEMVTATQVQLRSGADGIWIYRSDALEGRWDGVRKSAHLVEARQRN